MENVLYRYEPTPLSTGFVYILSNAGRSTLYIGVTADLKNESQRIEKVMEARLPTRTT